MPARQSARRSDEIPRRLAYHRRAQPPQVKLWHPHRPRSVRRGRPRARWLAQSRESRMRLRPSSPWRPPWPRGGRSRRAPSAGARPRDQHPWRASSRPAHAYGGRATTRRPGPPAGRWRPSRMQARQWALLRRELCSPPPGARSPCATCARPAGQAAHSARAGSLPPAGEPLPEPARPTARGRRLSARRGCWRRWSRGAPAAPQPYSCRSDARV